MCERKGAAMESLGCVSEEAMEIGAENGKTQPVVRDLSASTNGHTHIGSVMDYGRCAEDKAGGNSLRRCEDPNQCAGCLVCGFYESKGVVPVEGKDPNPGRCHEMPECWTHRRPGQPGEASPTPIVRDEGGAPPASANGFTAHRGARDNNPGPENATRQENGCGGDSDGETVLDYEGYAADHADNGSESDTVDEDSEGIRSRAVDSTRRVTGREGGEASISGYTGPRSLRPDFLDGLLPSTAPDGADFPPDESGGDPIDVGEELGLLQVNGSGSRHQCEKAVCSRLKSDVRQTASSIPYGRDYSGSTVNAIIMVNTGAEEACKEDARSDVVEGDDGSDASRGELQGRNQRRARGDSIPGDDDEESYEPDASVDSVDTDGGGIYGVPPFSKRTSSVAACSTPEKGVADDGNAPETRSDGQQLWACPHCTFNNPLHNLHCEMCQFTKSSVRRLRTNRARPDRLVYELEPSKGRLGRRKREQKDSPGENGDQGESGVKRSRPRNAHGQFTPSNGDRGKASRDENPQDREATEEASARGEIETARSAVSGSSSDRTADEGESTSSDNDVDMRSPSVDDDGDRLGARRSPSPQPSPVASAKYIAPLGSDHSGIMTERWRGRALAMECSFFDDVARADAKGFCYRPTRPGFRRRASKDTSSERFSGGEGLDTNVLLTKGVLSPIYSAPGEDRGFDVEAGAGDRGASGERQSISTGSPRISTQAARVNGVEVIELGDSSGGEAYPEGSVARRKSRPPRLGPTLDVPRRSHKGLPAGDPTSTSSDSRSRVSYFRMRGIEQGGVLSDGCLNAELLLILLDWLKR